MEDSQEASCRSADGHDTMKCSWCDELAISDFVGHFIDDG